MPYLPFELSPRVALAAPANHDQDIVQSTALIIISILSAVGAAWIMFSFVIFKSLRSFRHQLILGLAASDFFMAINFAGSAGMNIAGRFIGEPAQESFCTFNGFMTQLFVIQTDYWVLTVAICTYFILADHKHSAAWVQDHRYWLFAIPWAFSCLWAGVGLGTAGYGNIGGWCWFTSDEVRLLANFVPRWIIISIMLALYARLYWVLYKAHNRFLSFNSSTDPNSRSRDLASGHNMSNDESRRQAKNTRRLKRLAKMMLLYPLAYMIIWTLPTSVRIYQTIKHQPAPFALQTVDKCCIVIQGFVDAVIYGANESSLSSWRNVLWPSRFPVQNSHNNNHNGPPIRDMDIKPDRMRASRIHHHNNGFNDTTSDSVSSLDMTVTPTQTGKAYAAAEKIEMSDMSSNGRRGSATQSAHSISEGSEDRIIAPTIHFGKINIRKTVDVEVVEHSGPAPPLPEPNIMSAASPPNHHKRTFLRE